MFCSLPKTKFHFLLHCLIKKRNKYTEWCHNMGRYPLLPSVRNSKKVERYFLNKRFLVPIRGGFKKKKLVEFSIKLAGWVLDDPVFHFIKKRICMALKHFILPEMHFKANLFFSYYDPPPNPPHHSASKLSAWGIQKG